MSWDAKTATGKRYYYRSRRSGTRTVKVYIGRGPQAERAAAEDARRRAARLEAREARLRELADLAAADTVTREFRSLAALLAAAALLGNGFYEHRGQWRRRGRAGRRRQAEG